MNLAQQRSRLWLIGLALASNWASPGLVPSAWATVPLVWEKSAMDRGVLPAAWMPQQNQTTPARSLQTADGRLAQSESIAGDEDSVITSETFSSTGLTLPSLWWVKDQFSQKKPLATKLLRNWRAYPGNPQRPGQIELLVNRQFWSLLDYVERYTFLNEFGEAAREYRYNIQVIDSDAPTNAPLASYTCDFSLLAPPPDAAIADPAQPPPTRSVVGPNLDVNIPNLPCQISLDSSGKAGFRGDSIPASSGTKGLHTDGP